MSIKSETPCSGEILQVRLERTRWHANDIHHPRSGADASDGHIDRSRGLADDSRGWADILSAPNKPEMANISHSKGAGTYLGVGDVKHAVHTTDGIGSHVDMSSGPTDVPSIEMGVRIPINATETIRTPQK